MYHKDPSYLLDSLKGDLTLDVTYLIRIIPFRAHMSKE